jgi:ketol-acid reductoisomerase
VTNIYRINDAETDYLLNRTISVIGYGNQGHAQALNLRDSGLHVIIGSRNDQYADIARSDGLEVFEISHAVANSQVVMLLVPDEVLPKIFEEQVRHHLAPGCAVVFASGYNIAFNQVRVNNNVDILLLAPRMIGVGVRERYLTEEGFYCFIGVHQDTSGNASKVLLALTWGIGGLVKPAIEVSFKQEATLDLFNEQAFGPAFGRVLLNAISILVDNGLPPEAVLVEMYMSEEMAYTYRKMAQVGLVKQTLFHSQTSQYGAMSRGVRFLNLGLKDRMEKIFAEIDSGSFAREWSSPLSKIKFKAIRYFAMRQRINKLESQVRKSLKLEERSVYQTPPDIDRVMSDPRIVEELESFIATFEF